MGTLVFPYPNPVFRPSRFPAHRDPPGPTQGREHTLGAAIGVNNLSGVPSTFKVLTEGFPEGSLNGNHSGGDQTMQIYGNFEGFAMFGLFFLNDPCPKVPCLAAFCMLFHLEWVEGHCWNGQIQGGLETR